MVKLFCAIVGEGSAFEVNIDNTESVSALQKVISAALRYRGRPDLLQLFLAKTEENGWMTYDEDLANKLLQNRVDTSKLKALWPTWKLNRAKDPQLFGKDLLLGEDVVHVLVRLPKEQSVPSRTRVHSEIEDQKSMKRLKTSEVDKWKWKEEEPMYSRNRRLFFVNREKAVRDLIEYHKENFIRARDGSGGEWVIPLLDSMFGIGKSAFGQEYIRRCQSLKPDTTADEFMTTLCSCHTIRITLSQEHVLDKNGDFDSYLASLSLVECLRDFFEANYDVLPHTFDSREEDYVEILEDLTEEVGPLFIVFDDIGLAFEHDKLDDVAKREQFFEFCTMLQPLFENRKLFFLIAGTASFLDYFTTYTTFNIPFEFEQLDLHPLGRDSIKTIIKKTRWDRTKSESIQDQLQLTEEQVTLAADHLLDTTFGHPRSLQLALERCESYDDLLTYTTKRDTVESCLETMDVKMSCGVKPVLSGIRPPKEDGDRLQTLQSQVDAAEAVVAAMKAPVEAEKAKCPGGIFVLVDLTGAEYTGEGLARSSKEHKEAREINSSLLALKECIRVQAQRGTGHIPYRNSKLTMLLKCYLETDKPSSTIMITNVLATKIHLRKALDSIRYAALVASAFNSSQDEKTVMKRRKSVK